MNRLLAASVSALTLAFLAGGAQAGPITADTVGWTYNFSTSAPNNQLMGSQGGYLLLDIKDNGQGPGSGTANGTSNIVATNLKVVSTAVGSSAETLLDKTFNLSLQLSSLEPNATPSTATLNFAVALQGRNPGDPATFSANNSNIFLASFTPLSGPGVTIANGVAKVTLGSFTFAVSSPSFTAPGPSTQFNEGSMSVLVSVSSSNGGGTAQQVPEPATGLLACLGGLSFAGLTWRKRKLKRELTTV
jgi:hypothetical protein